MKRLVALICLAQLYSLPSFSCPLGLSRKYRKQSPFFSNEFYKTDVAKQKQMVSKKSTKSRGAT